VDGGARVSAAAGEPGPERTARASLTYLAEPGDPWLARLVRDHGPQRAVEAIKAGEVPARDGTVGDAAGGPQDSPQAAARAMERWRVRLGEIPEPADIAALRARGMRLIIPSDPEWPARLGQLGDHQPYGLWLRGSATDLGGLCDRSVAIVGSRAATGYGTYVTAEIAASVAARGWTVISGGAYGVDGSAHRGALGADGLTLAVMACGVDRPYPAGHADLLDAVAEAGAVISEWPPGRSVGRLRFLVRNRVIAALAKGTVVIEAGKRSGALNTARHARDLGRTLMAVPGPVTSDMSAGCHCVIRDWDGTLVTSADEVIETLSSGDSLGGPPAPHLSALAPGLLPAASPEGGRSRADVVRDALDQEAAMVLDALPARGGLPTPDIAVRAGLDDKTVRARLAVLAVLGLAERADRGWRVRRVPR
jgi:DNA processing protein